MIEDIALGEYTTPSGNHCVATLHVDKAAMASVSFTWKSTPTADDREEWSFTILADAVHRARDTAFGMRAVVEVIREWVAAGALERVGVDPAGDWVFRGKNISDASLPPGVVSLFARRQDRRSRGDLGRLDEMPKHP